MPRLRITTKNEIDAVISYFLINSHGTGLDSESDRLTTKYEINVIVSLLNFIN